MVRQSRFVIMRMYNNFHLTFSKNQNIIKNERVANERKSSFCYSFFLLWKIHWNYKRSCGNGTSLSSGCKRPLCGDGALIYFAVDKKIQELYNEQNNK